MPNLHRCSWVDLSKPDYVAYHDDEWGVPVRDDRKLFEYLLLESAQAGLSWYTVLKKREGYRQAFDNFDAEKMVSYDEAKVEELLQNPGIIRNRAKVNAALNAARLYLEIQAREGSFSDFIWQFVDGETITNRLEKLEEAPATTPESDAMSKVLKQLGFKFTGSTICYAFMQATGMVNDHLVDCYRWHELKTSL